MFHSEVRDGALPFETFASLMSTPPFNLAPDDPLLRAFFREATIVELGTGETLCKEGERADAFWVLVTGALQVSSHDHAGRSVVVARVDAGNVVGETALLRGASGFRNATVKAAEPSRLWRVGTEAIDELEARSHLRWSALRQLDTERMLVRLRMLMEHLGVGALRVLDPVERRLRRGEVVFHEGDEARHVYLLTTGSVALYRTQDGHPLLVGMLEPEQCFGELGVLERKPRSVTVVADTDAVVLEIDGALFSEAFDRSAELRDYVDALSRTYSMPRRGFVSQLSGRVSGEACITTVFDLLSGERWVASQVVGRHFFVARRVEPNNGSVATHVYSSAEVRRSVSVDASGRLIALECQGWWADLEELQASALDGVSIDPDRLDVFAATGRLSVLKSAPGARVICSCLQVTYATVEAAIASGCDTFECVMARTGSGSVCGGCAPRVRDLLGTEGWSDIELFEHTLVAPDVVRLRFRPARGNLPAHKAGQYVLLQGRINGLWVQRPYTLTSAAGGDDHHEVLVERVAGGEFSSWLFDTKVGSRRLQVSPPQGAFTWIADDRPTVCWVAGIGITPALSVVRTADRIDHEAPLHVDLSVRHRTHAAEIDVLQEIAARRATVTTHVRVTSESPRLSVDDVAAIVEQLPRARHMVCGPPGYLEAVSRMLEMQGVAAEDILIEHFRPVAPALPQRRSPTAGRPSFRPRDRNGDRHEEVRTTLQELARGGTRLGRCPLGAPTDEGEAVELVIDADPPGVHDGVGFVATTYTEVQNIPALEVSCTRFTAPKASTLSTWHAVLQAAELAIDVGARLAADIARRLDQGHVEAAADRMDWLSGIHALLVALADAGGRATGPLAPEAGHTVSVRSSPARARLMEATQRIDRAIRRTLERADPAHGDQLGALFATGALCNAPARLDRAFCIMMEHWRVWESSLDAVPLGVPDIDYATFVDAAGVARILDRPSYDDSTLINPFRGLHLVPERLAREAIDLLDSASSYLEEAERTTDSWAQARQLIVAAARLVAPMRGALLAMVEGLGVAEYRRFRKNFGRTSASESAALAEALLHRAPERLGDALAEALSLVEGEALGKALERLPLPQQWPARATLEAVDELHREMAWWLDTHMLLPVLHLGMSRSLAGRSDAVTSNRLKRAETLGRGWFGGLGTVPVTQADPSAELDAVDGYLRWRALRLGDLQLADAAHLAEGEPAGRVLGQLAAVLRRVEGAEREESLVTRARVDRSLD